MKHLSKIIGFFLVLVWLGAMYRVKFGHNTLTKAAPDILILGVDAQQPPFAFVQDNHVTGFTIDLARAFGGRMGKKILVRDIPEEQLINDLSSDVIHVAALENVAQDFDTNVRSTLPYLEEYTPHLFVVTEKNSALLSLINTALEEIREDGTLIALKQKWNVPGKI